MRVLVTGAAGFVGRGLAPYLSKAGHEVTAASRNPASITGVKAVPISSIGPETDWRSALEGIDCVIHLAARAHILHDTAADPLAEHRRINTEGTRRLAQKAADQGVSHFIFLSSIGVLGNNSRNAKNGVAFTDDDLPNPHDAYSRSKWEAEQALREVMGPKSTIIRSPLIYGEGVPGNFQKLLEAAKAGKLFPLGGVHNQRTLLGLENLCSFILACLTSDSAIGKTYVVADNESTSTADLYRMLCRAMKSKGKVVNIREPILRATLTAFGRKKMMERLCDNLVVDASRAKKELSWNPPKSLEEGLAETVHAYVGESP